MLPCKQVLGSSRAFQKLHVCFLCITLAGQFSSVQSCQQQACRSSILTASATTWDSAACNHLLSMKFNTGRPQIPAPSQLKHITLVYSGRLRQESPDLSYTFLARHELESVSSTVSISHLLNVDCGSLGDVQGYVMLRGGSRGAAAAVQLGCARQDLHIQTTCNQTNVQTDVQTYRHTDRQKDRQTQTNVQTDRQTQTGRSHLTCSTPVTSSQADQTYDMSPCC